MKFRETPAKVPTNKSHDEDSTVEVDVRRLEMETDTLALAG